MLTAPDPPRRPARDASGASRGRAVTRIDLYIARQLTVALVAVTTGLVALIWLTQSLRYVELVVNRGLSARVFIELTALLIPYFVAIILPIATFVVVLFIYQRLAGDRELTVMRATGRSQLALARPALAVAVLAAGLGYALNLYVVPESFTRFREYQFEIRNRLAAFLLQDGVFTPVSDNLTVYVRARDADGTLHGILIDDARKPDSRATIMAETGKLIADADVPRVLLENGSRQVIDKRTGQLDVLTFDRNAIDLTESGKQAEERLRDPTEMSVSELLHPRPGVISDRDRPKLVAEAHRRLSAPLGTLSYAMVALVAVLMGAFSRREALVRPVLAILAVVGLVASSLMVGNLAARVNALVPLMWVMAILPGVLCAIALFGPRLRASAWQGA